MGRKKPCFGCEVSPVLGDVTGGRCRCRSRFDRQKTLEPESSSKKEHMLVASLQRRSFSSNAQGAVGPSVTGNQ